ncbi:MAG: hypothetical protein ABSB15_03240 [Bryobacteraceae bacterium]
MAEARFSHGWMADTHPDALRIFLDLNHRLPVERKVAQIVEMYETMNATYAAQERRSHPEACEREIFFRVAARRLGREMVKKAYGWAPGE